MRIEPYALLLVAYSKGMTPAGGSKAMVPVFGDDPDELEIVQFGAQLSADQIGQALELASRLASPAGLNFSMKELLLRQARYKLIGKH